MKKRILAFLLAFSVLVGVTVSSEKKAYASATAVIVGGGAVVGAETAFAYLLGILGVTAASAAVYENRDSIIEWGASQISKFSSWASEKKDQFSAWAGSTAADVQASISAWCDSLSKGQVEKNAQAWAALKEWLSGDVYTSSPDASYNDYPWVGKNLDTPFPGKTYHYKTSISDSGSFFECNFITTSNKHLIHVIVTDTTSYRISQLDSSEKENSYFEWTGRSDAIYDFNGGTFYRALGNDLTSWNESRVVNFIGRFSSKNDGYLEAVRILSGGAVSGVIEGSQDYSFSGGVSDVLGGAGSLENVDVVGTGSKADDSDLVIRWPSDYAFDRVLGDVVVGDKTWADAVGSLGVGVIDKSVDGDFVIGNDGVTDKVWEYEREVEAPDITIPDTGEEVSKDLKDYTIAGLEKVFPFCLPFDLVDFIQVLEAPPEAPKFTLPLRYPTSDGWVTGEVVVDLSSFDDVASLLRDMECLLFIVGLIVVTRSRMIRG